MSVPSCAVSSNIIKEYKMGTNNGRTQLRRLLDLVRTLENTNRGWRVAALASRYNVDQSRDLQRS